MPDSKRLQIQKALTGELQKITPANGYDHDLSQSVVRGRLRLDSNDLDAVPLVSILEAPKPGEVSYPDGGNAQQEHWELLLSGWVKPDTLNPTDPAHALLLDVKKGLAPIRESILPHQQSSKPAWRLGGLISNLQVGGGICRPPDEHSNDAAYFLLPIKITFVEDLENP